MLCLDYIKRGMCMNTKMEVLNTRDMAGNDLENALVVMHNQLARKQTKWNARETKLFFTALSQIKWRDSENWVRLSKAAIIETLEIDPHDTNKLRDMYVKVMHKSLIKFDGPTEEEWDDGFLITRVKTTKKEVYVKFASDYLPLLERLEEQFTMFHLENVLGFKSKYAIVLFQDLKSRYNPEGVINHWQYKLDELKYLFNVQEGEYIRKTGRNKGIFDTANFKIKTLDRAVEEINKDVVRSGMHIENVEVLKHRGRVVGYDIAFSLISKDGTRYNAELDEQLSLFEEEQI